MTTSPLRSALDRLEKTGRTLTAVALWLLLGATVGGLVLPNAPSLAAPGYHDLPSAAAPVRLEVPSLHIDAPIVPIEVTPDGTLDPPSNPREVGYWKRSAEPGSLTGQTVVTGHTVHTGGGQMDHLGSIQQGATIKIVTPVGTMWYRETQVLVYSKAQLSRHAEELFSQKRKHNRLVLITCTGWTGTIYTSNVVVFAKPLGVPDAPPPDPHKQPGKHAPHKLTRHTGGTTA